MEKTYDPKSVENKIYKLWEKSGYFNPDKLPKTYGLKTKTYIVYMPLPNVTGTLHIGHTLNNTIQDILIRYHRLKGYRTLWLPGTDHAGIATQYVVEKELKKEGLTRFQIGREKFIEKVWEWKSKYGGIILDQLKKLGCSADWSRTRFTMDKAYSRDVLKAFIHYYKKGLIYRGLRTVNWCPCCTTSLSELELEYEEEKTKLYYIRYGPFVLATVRPETKFGDTAIAVHPRDKRYKKYIGQTLEIDSLDINGQLEKPALTKIKLRVVADEAVDPKFGTGVIKVTPAHDITDFEIAQRHNLPLNQIIDEHGRMNQNAGKYAGLKTMEAREKIVEDLKAVGLLVKEEPYEHRLTKCYRCNTIIEPLPSKQWFLKMGELAKMAVKAVRSGEVKIKPKKFEKPYFAWLENIRDWTISRQIWWGHRLPVWFHEPKCIPRPGREKDIEKCEETKVALTEPKCRYCGAKFVQSEDVLDTWFSSALWPFAGLSQNDLKKYYPGNTLITARDILNLWVARMIFSGLEFKGRTPFTTVFINGTILDREGKRMSKSKGTGVDPLNYIDQYGADATRFAVIWQANGQDIRWDETAVIAGRKFTNKIWNAGRFVLQQTENNKLPQTINCKPQTLADKKIIKELAATNKKVEEFLEKFEFSKALHEIYDFFWHKYCDVYLEKSKSQLTSPKLQKNTTIILLYVLLRSLKILHPFMPFITEEIYQKLPLQNKKILMVESWIS